MNETVAFARSHVEEARQDAWAALAAWLAETARRLDGEVREYPSPIARCDAQLPKLLEQRGRAHEALREMAHWDGRGQGAEGAPSPEAIGAILEAGPATDEEAEAALRERLRSSLHALPCLD